MGTKRNPGAIDCYEAALPDEPIFVLRGCCPLSAALVRIWAALRDGDSEAYLEALDELAEASRLKQQPADPDKIVDAKRVADEMDAWRETLAATVAGQGGTGPAGASYG